MLEWIFISLYTIILHNKMMCHALHQATYSQGQGHSLGKHCLTPMSCLGFIFHMLECILVLVHTIILHNKMMCLPSPCSHGQGHSLGSTISRPQFLVRVVSSMCLNGFLCHFTQLFSIKRWCVMHVTKPPTPKFIVTCWAQTFSVQIFVTGLYFPCTCLNGFLYYFIQLFSITRWCDMHITQPPTPKVNIIVWAQTLSDHNVQAISSTCLNGF